MSVSRSKRKKKRKNRNMRPVRLEAVRKIEKNQPSEPTAAPPPLEKPTDPATQKQIEELRRLGLSVSVNASPEKIRALRQEFEVVTKYVQSVIQALVPDANIVAKLSEDQLIRFTAMLFGDGQIVTGITMSQQARSALSPNQSLQTKTREFKYVARLLRVQFPQLIPAQPWWSRLLPG